MASGRYPNLETGSPDYSPTTGLNAHLSRRRSTSPDYSSSVGNSSEAPIRNTVTSSYARPTMVTVARYHSRTSPRYTDADEDRSEAPNRNTVPSSSARPTMVTVARYHSPTSPRYTPTSPRYSDSDEDRSEAPIRNTVPSSIARPTLVTVARYHSRTSPRYTPTSPGYSDADEDRSASPRSSADVQSIEKMKTFRIDEHEYVINHFLGKGEYGVVFSVSNKNQEMFAAKFLKALQSASKIAPGEIELKVYDLLRQSPHPQLLQLVSTGDLLSTPAGFSTRVILTRVLGLSIYDTLNKAKEREIQSRARNGSTSSMIVPRVAFPLQSIKMMCQQIVNAMDHLENLKVYHLDLKTANIYFTENEDFQLDFSDNSHSLIQLSDVTIQIGDFGVCRFHEVDGAATVPRIVQTQFYRAPEILLGLPYDTKADVWSFGAVAAELYTGDFLFPGAVGPDSDVSQFQKILTVTNARMPREMMKKAEKYGSASIGGNVHAYLKRSASSSSSTQGLLQLKRSDEAKAFFSMLTSVLILNPDSRPSFKKIKKNKCLV